MNTKVTKTISVCAVDEVKLYYDPEPEGLFPVCLNMFVGLLKPVWLLWQKHFFILIMNGGNKSHDNISG